MVAVVAVVAVVVGAPSVCAAIGDEAKNKSAANTNDAVVTIVAAPAARVKRGACRIVCVEESKSWDWFC